MNGPIHTKQLLNLLCIVYILCAIGVKLQVKTSKFREFMSPAIIVYYLNEKKVKTLKND